MRSTSVGRMWQPTVRRMGRVQCFSRNVSCGGRRAQSKRRLRSGRTQTENPETGVSGASEKRTMQEYETIKAGRAMLQAAQANAPSERTVVGYAAKTGLIMRCAGPDADIEALIAQAKQTRSASAWFSRRAALMYSFRLGVGKLLVEKDSQAL
jgi:hypothetical protein